MDPSSSNPPTSPDPATTSNPSSASKQPPLPLLPIYNIEKVMKEVTTRFSTEEDLKISKSAKIAVQLAAFELICVLGKMSKEAEEKNGRKVIRPATILEQFEKLGFPKPFIQIAEKVYEKNSIMHSSSLCNQPANSES